MWDVMVWDRKGTDGSRVRSLSFVSAYPSVRIDFCQLLDEGMSQEMDRCTVEVRAAGGRIWEEAQAADAWSRFGSHVSRIVCKSFGRIGLAT